MQKFVPSYSKVASLIETFIKEENIETLPSERDLCSMFDVSRTTIRNALNELVKDSVIYKVDNRGYFVKKQNGILNVQTQTQSLLDNMKATEVDTHVISKQIILANEFIANKLDISNNEAVFNMKRLRHTKDGTIYIMETFVPLRLCLGIEQVNNSEFESRSFWSILKSYQHNPSIKEQRVSVIKADKETSISIHVKENDPLLFSETLAYSEDVALEYATITTDAYSVKYIFNY